MTAPAEDLSTRDRLTTTAARLFRQRGYHGTGLSEILSEAGVPKGSLYHHFPEGKADLACAAADWTAGEIVLIVDAAFQGAADWRQGATIFCHKMARLFEKLEDADACPIVGLMFDGPDNGQFRDRAEAAFHRIIVAAAAHGQKLGLAIGQAEDAAELLMVGFQGSWTLARMRRDAGVLRALPTRLYGSASA